MPCVLVAASESSVDRALAEFLSARGCAIAEPEGAQSRGAVRVSIAECCGDHPQRALRNIERCLQAHPLAPVIAYAFRGSEELAVAAFRAGAKDYYRWPAQRAELFGAIDGYLKAAPLDGVRITGQSAGIRAVAEQIRRAASTDSNVLIAGETGTGKELVAQSLHAASARAGRAMVSVNCAAIPDTLLESELFGYERGAFTGAVAARQGKLQQANGGTIFFDEVGDMNACGQAKLLRAVETREVQPLGSRKAVSLDLRIVAATNQSLETMVRQGTFRADLLYRLDVIRIDMPPLRQRAGDVPALLDHFAAHFNARWGHRIRAFDDDCRAALSLYDWPGNVRELRNVVEAVYVNSRGGVITRRDLPAAIRDLTAEVPPALALPIDERRELVDALYAMNWNVSRVAEKLQWSRMTVYRKLARYRISRQTAVCDTV